ncbi:uncharacterized protein UBRO_20639 [Ustilago bromivora]|uniref:Uncharacterized protein n=1 Tax=Ustilago bromivora TaxID=307758 RepID=A0A1K0G436_9BASI|nr:uncharacterized protein UBRO_20639 [Ustilago bromivora]
MSTNCYMFTNHRNNTSCVNLYLLQMELGIEEGLADAEQLSQTPKQPSTSTTSNHARPAARASRSQNQDTDSGKYFVWDNNKRSLLKGCLTKEQEKGLKTSKETLYKQIYDEIFPNSNITNSGSCVKTKLCWLESQYITIKKTFLQTGSGLLLCDHSSDCLHPSAGPVTLVTSSAYNSLQASQSSNGDAGDAMEEDNISFPSGYSIPGLEALAEAAPHDPIVPRVLSSSSAFSFPSTSANPFGSPGAAPRNHLASTAFGVDQEPKKESTGLSSPTKKTSASKKQDDIADLVQACTAESLQACIKSNSNVDTMLANMPGSSSNDSASHCQHNISNDEVSNSVF